MADRFSKETRSKIMQAIRGSDTGPELRLRKALFKAGYRYRKQHRIGRYKIDIAFPSKKVAIFVDGCFWHKCPKHCKLPKSNKSYWLPKLQCNVERDKEFRALLQKEGWKVFHFWEHELANISRIVAKIEERLEAHNM